MLHVYLKNHDGDPYSGIDKPVVRNVQAKFMRTQVKDLPSVREAIRALDGGEYVNDRAFKDRFGDMIGIENLCSGTKAVIVLSCNDGVVIDTIECGHNALDFIIHLDVDAGIVINEDWVSFSPEFGKDIKVTYHGKGKNSEKVVTTIEDLNYIIGI